MTVPPRHDQAPKPKRTRRTTTATKGKAKAVGQISARARGAKKNLRDAKGLFEPKLTPKVIADLEQALASGFPPADAAPFAGISRASFHDYMSRGRTPGADQIYVDLVEMVERSIATWGVGVSAAMTKAARDGDVHAQKFMLERRFPHAFGPSQRVEIGNADDSPFKVLAAQFDPTRLAEMDEGDLLKLQALLHTLVPAPDANVIDLQARRRA